MRKNTILIGAIAAIICILLIAANIPAAPEAFVDDYGTDYGAVGVWNFEEGTGTTTYDQSPYGNDGSGYVPPVTGDGAWLIGWNKRVKITINSTDVDNTLTDFPDLIFLSNSTAGENDEDVSFVFDEIGGNSKKIAVTTSDGLTECYVEIEKWDATNEQAWLWTKVPSVASGADTDLYLYFDNDHADNDAYVGDPSDAVVHNVWDDNFKLVTHMRDDPDTSHIRDSTVNANDGTKKGANEPIVTTAGIIDDSQDFDGVNDYVHFSDLGTLTVFSYSAWFKLDVYDGYRTILSNPAPMSDAMTFHSTTHKIGEYHVPLWTTTTIELDTWYWICITKDAGDDWALYLDGELEDTENADLDFSGEFWVGCFSGTGQWWNGIIDEFRISNIARTPAWANATYESGRDHLNDFGSEETITLREDMMLWRSGKFGSAIWFNGSYYVDVGNVTSSLRTIWFWINLNSTSEPILEINGTVYLNVTDGTLAAYNFTGTPTFYVDGIETTTITSSGWHHVGVISDANENCTDLTIGAVGTDYLNGTIDQLRIYTVSKTVEEIWMQYLDPTGGMYSGSVIVSDRFLILNSTFGEVLVIRDGIIDIFHSSIVNADDDDWFTISMGPGVTDVVVNTIPPGVLLRDRYYHRLTLGVDTAPGAGKSCSISLSDGTNTMTVTLSDAETNGWTTTGEFVWDASAETLTFSYSQDAGGAATNGYVTIKRHYLETP